MKSANKIFHSLVVVMLFLVIFCLIFPVVGLFKVIYNRSMNEFESILYRTIQTETSSYAKLLEQDLESIRLQTYGVLSESTVSTVGTYFELGTVHSTSFELQLQKVQSYIQSIVKCHSIIDSIELYYPRSSRLITTNSQKLCTGEEEKIKEMVSQGKNSNVWVDSGSLIYWYAKSPNANLEYENMSSVIVSTMSSYKLKSYLKKYTENTQGAYFALSVDGSNGKPFFVSTDSTFLPDDLPIYKQPTGYSEMEVEKSKYLLAWYTLEDNMVFYQLKPLEQIRTQLDEYEKILNLFTWIFVCFALGFALLLYWMIYKPIAHAKATFLRMEKEGAGVLMGKAWYQEFQSMYVQFDNMSRHIQQLIEQEYELRLLHSKAQLKQLQYQINPHFLYNTYFTLQGLLQEEEYDKAAEMSRMLGKYLRYITVSDDDETTLEVELEHARTYAQIQQMRFLNRICIQFSDYEKELKGLKIPMLVIQPLLENAFYHGMRNVLSGGLIQVQISSFAGGFSVIVEDNGSQLTDEKLRELKDMLKQKEVLGGDSVALFNIHRRLVLKYGKGSGLFVSRSLLGGLCCRLDIIYTEGDSDAQNFDC